MSRDCLRGPIALHQLQNLAEGMVAPPEPPHASERWGEFHRVIRISPELGAVHDSQLPHNALLVTRCVPAGSSPETTFVLVNRAELSATAPA